LSDIDIPWRTSQNIQTLKEKNSRWLILLIFFAIFWSLTFMLGFFQVQRRWGTHHTMFFFLLVTWFVLFFIGYFVCSFFSPSDICNIIIKFKPQFNLNSIRLWHKSNQILFYFLLSNLRRIMNIFYFIYRRWKCPSVTSDFHILVQDLKLIKQEFEISAERRIDYKFTFVATHKVIVL